MKNVSNVRNDGLGLCACLYVGGRPVYSIMDSIDCLLAIQLPLSDSNSSSSTPSTASNDQDDGVEAEDNVNNEDDQVSRDSVLLRRRRGNAYVLPVF